MPCVPFKTQNGTGYMCYHESELYKFDGWLFEFQNNLGGGFWPLNKDGYQRQRPPGRKFWDMIGEFEKLNDEEKEKYKI